MKSDACFTEAEQRGTTTPNDRLSCDCPPPLRSSRDLTADCPSLRPDGPDGLTRALGGHRCDISPVSCMGVIFLN